LLISLQLITQLYPHAHIHNLHTEARKPCPHCRRKVWLSPFSPFSATVSLFCGSVDRALNENVAQQSPVLIAHSVTEYFQDRAEMSSMHLHVIMANTVTGDLSHWQTFHMFVIVTHWGIFE